MTFCHCQNFGDKIMTTPVTGESHGMTNVRQDFPCHDKEVMTFSVTSKPCCHGYGHAVSICLGDSGSV